MTNTSSILCLDIATKTGYAVIDNKGVILDSGTFNFSKKSKDSDLSRVVKFREAINQMLTKHPQIRSFVFERVDFSKYTMAHAVHHQLLSVLMLSAHDFNKKLVSVSVGTLKKHSTGNGRASKEEMIDAASKSFPMIDIGDDNEADALNVANWAYTTKYKEVFE